MAEILVTAATVRNKANELSNLNGQLKSKVSDLVGKEENLNGMWDGEANDAFHKAFGDDVQQMQNFTAEIERYVDALLNIATEYENAERMNTAIGTERKYH